MKLELLDYDIVVLGGGPGGLPAAIAAAREGARVLLVEKNGYLGGNLTLGLPLLGFLDKDGNPVIGGIAQELIEALRARGACGEHHWCPMHDSVTIYNDEVFKIVAFEACRKAGVELLLHTQVIDANVENGRIRSVTLFGKGRRMEVTAKVFLDATGDGDLGYLAGARYEKGQKETGTLQPPTLMCTVDGVDIEKTIAYVEANPEQMRLAPTIETYPGFDGRYFRANPDQHVMVGFRKLFLELKAEGILPVDRDTMIYIETLTPGRVNLNCTRHLGIDGSDVRDLTCAEIEGHLQNLELIDVLRQYVPGFEHCQLTKIYPFIGIRETRRFHGLCTLTEQDLLSGSIPADTIGLGSYIIDIHDGGGNGTIVKKVRPYGMPYSMTVSADLTNLMFSGRCASMDAVALSSCRVMPPLMAMGQGAGVGEANRRCPGPNGRFDWAAIGQVLHEIGYEDDVVMEPFVRMGGQVGRDVSLWRDLSGGADDAKLDQDAAASLRWLRGVMEGSN